LDKAISKPRELIPAPTADNAAAFGPSFSWIYKMRIKPPMHAAAPKIGR